MIIVLGTPITSFHLRSNIKESRLSACENCRLEPFSFWVVFILLLHTITNADSPAVEWVGQSSQVFIRPLKTSEEVDLSFVCRVKHMLVADNAVAVRVWAVKPRPGGSGDRVELTAMFQSGQPSPLNYTHSVGLNSNGESAEIPFLMRRVQSIDYTGIPHFLHLKIFRWCWLVDDTNEQYPPALMEQPIHSMLTVALIEVFRVRVVDTVAHMSARVDLHKSAWMNHILVSQYNPYERNAGSVRVNRSWDSYKLVCSASTSRFEWLTGAAQSGLQLSNPHECTPYCPSPETAGQYLGTL